MRIIISCLLLAMIFSVSHVFAASSLDQINQKVCDRFEEDLSRLAAIMEEVRRREGITETRAAFGGVHTAIDSPA